MMRWIDSCPHCEAILNPGSTIMLVRAPGNARVMVGFHPEPGNNRISVPPGQTIEKNSRWDFECQLCRRSLISDLNPNLCCLDMITHHQRHPVYCSRIAGEHATFVASAEGLEQHGEHVHRHSLELLKLV
jgi:hypothetical protein